MSISLAVKYRPQKWEEMIGQESIIAILKKELETETFKNCYLFCGSSGCGKTTTARLVANKINQNQGSPIEIDAASNSGVDNIRSIIKSAQERSLDSKYKVFIIDEAHALSNQAWQAFLKCIEEPPEYTIFIFCTTDVQKVPATIINRVERFNFSKVHPDIIENRLAYICEQEHFTNFKDTISYIAKVANGGVRDAIALLDKCASFSNDLDIKNTLPILGAYSYDDFFVLLNNLIDGEEGSILQLVDKYFKAGQDLKLFLDQFISFVLDVDKYAIFKDCELLTIPAAFKAELDRVIKIEKATDYFMYVLNKLLDLKLNMKADINAKVFVEITLLQICRCK